MNFIYGDYTYKASSVSKMHHIHYSLMVMLPAAMNWDHLPSPPVCWSCVVPQHEPCHKRLSHIHMRQAGGISHISHLL